MGQGIRRGMLCNCYTTRNGEYHICNIHKNDRKQVRRVLSHIRQRAKLMKKKVVEV